MAARLPVAVSWGVVMRGALSLAVKLWSMRQRALPFLLRKVSLTTTSWVPGPHRLTWATLASRSTQSMHAMPSARLSLSKLKERVLNEPSQDSSGPL